MRAFVCLIVVVVAYSSSAQSSLDTLWLNQYERADTIYGRLGKHIKTGLLLNRTMLDTSEAFVYNANKIEEYVPRADHFYALLRELKVMALDSSRVPEALNVYNATSNYIGKLEFHEDRYVYPIGIADFNYNWLDENYGENSGLLVPDGIGYGDANEFDGSAYSMHNVALIAPLFDYFVSDQLSIVFHEKNFYSNYRTPTEITSIQLLENEKWRNIWFNEEYILNMVDGPKQHLEIKIEYTDGTFLQNKIEITTPEFSSSKMISEKSNLCVKKDTYWAGVNSLKYCMIPGCDNNSGLQGNPRPNKPYILVTGFRPPIFGQSFETTWNNYNTEHDNLMTMLLQNNFDVYLVKFNIHEVPQAHGMQESANLFRKFLEEINDTKIDKRNENIIQGSSMGADIVRLALLQMEREHMTNITYKHHHSRLFISYDGNFYGANISLAYQYQIYSGHFFPESPIWGFDAFYDQLKLFLYATLQQKTVKELLAYHAKAGQSHLFETALQYKEVIPKMHGLRMDYNNALAAVDNGESIFPMPNSTRNIAISLGKISGTNDLNVGGFYPAGTYWHNESVPGIQKIRSGYKTNYYTPLFHREKVLYNSVFGVPVIMGTVNHRVKVKEMLEIDNAAGSTLEDFGNLNYITEWAYFGFPLTQEHFTHKSVVTALGINSAYWPANGSMTLDMHDLGLMYKDFDILSIPQSLHHGYPNLGRPADHFKITPMESIYVDEQVDPHISLVDSDHIVQLNSYILNEVEPWYLGLQNDVLGSQARSDYPYLSRRRAGKGIWVGELVTPTTDPGPYITAKNSRLTLEAKEFIDIMPGTTFEEGSQVTATLDYKGCYTKIEAKNGESSNIETNGNVMDDNREKETNPILIFPNPNTGDFTVVAINNEPIEAIVIYKVSGQKMESREGLVGARQRIQTHLPKGAYVLHTHTIDAVYSNKIIIE